MAAAAAAIEAEQGMSDKEVKQSRKRRKTKGEVTWADEYFWSPEWLKVKKY